MKDSEVKKANINLKKLIENSKKRVGTIEDYFNHPTKEYWMGKRVRIYKIFMRMRMDNVSGGDDHFYWEEVNVNDVQKLENLTRRSHKDFVQIPAQETDKITGKYFIWGWITGFGTIQNGNTVWLGEYAGWAWETKKVLKCAKVRFNIYHREVKIPLDGFDLEHPF